MQKVAEKIIAAAWPVLDYLSLSLHVFVVVEREREVRCFLANCQFLQGGVGVIGALRWPETCRQTAFFAGIVITFVEWLTQTGGK